LRFTRKDVREMSGWGDTQCRVHLERLAQMEYLMAGSGRRGQVFEYELLYKGEGEQSNSQHNRFLMGLLDIDNVAHVDANANDNEHTSTTQSSRGKEAQFAGQGDDLAGLLRPQSGLKTGSLRVDQPMLSPMQEAGFDEITANELKTAVIANKSAAVLSYPSSSLAASV
jgi:hypothetical protein